jgi:invasion protein IalB
VRLISFGLAFSLAGIACGGSPPPPATGAPPEPGASAAPEPAGGAEAPAAPEANAKPDEKNDAKPEAAAKPATAEEAQAACTTTASWDKQEPNKLTFNVTNKSQREVKVCWLEFYLYDKAGKQLAHVTLPYNYKIAPGASDGQPYEFSDLGKQIGDKKVGSIETVTSSAKFTDGGEFEDKSLAPDQRPRAAKK